MHANVGDLVYNAFQPQKPGKVLRIVTEGKYFNTIEIKWISGEIEIKSEAGINNFRQLILDHQRKLETHMSKLPKLEEL